jgi:hypothetical protein
VQVLSVVATLSIMLLLCVYLLLLVSGKGVVGMPREAIEVSSEAGDDSTNAVDETGIFLSDLCSVVKD